MTEEDAGVRFARLLYKGAGIYGIVALAPMYFLEDLISTRFPPAITHPENYYGAVGLGLAWQVAFLVIATDPVRYRPMMPVTLIEKWSFGLAVFVLFAQGRVPAATLGPAIVDSILGLLFAVAYVRTGPAAGARA